MVSCLETVSMNARHAQIIRSDYQSVNPYVNMTGNMNTVKDLTMKGNMQGHGPDWLPDCTGQINVIDKFNFDTDPAQNFGNIADRDARQRMMTRSLYNYVNPYGTIDTSANVLDGQYVVL